MQTRAQKTLCWVLLRIPELVSAAALIFAITLTVVNAFTRYCLHFTIKGSDELICIAFAWMVFPGAAAAFRRRMHYGIDLVVGLFPPRGRAVIELVTQGLIAFILCTLTYLSGVLLANVGEKIMTATRISYRVLDSGLFVGFLLMAAYSIVFFVQDLRALPKKLSGKGGAKA